MGRVLVYDFKLLLTTAGLLFSFANFLSICCVCLCKILNVSWAAIRYWIGALNNVCCLELLFLAVCQRKFIPLTCLPTKLTFLFYYASYGKAFHLYLKLNGVCVILPSQLLFLCLYKCLMTFS